MTLTELERELAALDAERASSGLWWARSVPWAHRAMVAMSVMRGMGLDRGVLRASYLALEGSMAIAAGDPLTLGHIAALAGCPYGTAKSARLRGTMGDPLDWIQTARRPRRAS